MKIIGLTGGIGSGKSTVSAYLKEKGCIIIDADEISRKMTENGSSALDQIRACFGDEYFYADGSLDRKKMGVTVFNDSEKKRMLEDIVTQAVIRKTTEDIEILRKSRTDGIAVLDAPLLFEFNVQGLTDESWLVTADEETVLERVKLRDDMSEEEIRGRISNQMPLEDKKRIADRVIDNSKDLRHLYKQIDELLLNLTVCR